MVGLWLGFRALPEGVSEVLVFEKTSFFQPMFFVGFSQFLREFFREFSPFSFGCFHSGNPLFAVWKNRITNGFSIRILLHFIPQNDVRIDHSIGVGELGKKYKIAKKTGVAQEEIRHETDLFFRLMEQVVEVRH